MKNIDIIKDVKKIDTIETNVTQNTADITSIQTDLSVTENTKYSTVNGVKEFECKNGYIDNVVIEGQTKILDINNQECQPGSTGAKLVSVGQGDKIEVLSYENILSNDNLIIEDNFEVGGIVWTTGENAVVTDRLRSKNFVDVKSEVLFSNMRNDIAICCYDSSKKYLGYSTFGEHKYYNWLLPNTKFIRIVLLNNGGNFSKYSNLYLGYNKFQYDKKQILTTLRSLPNGVKDVIYKQGNKYYKIIRCIEFTIDGNYSIHSEYMPPSNTIRLAFDISGIVKYTTKGFPDFISDKIKRNVNYDNTAINEGFITGKESNYPNILWLFFDKSKVTNSNYKTYLNDNPITFVAELETPIIEELPNFNPCTFNDKTTILINSGVVQGEASFEVTNSTRSELEVLKGKFSDTEEGLLNNIYKYQKHQLTNDNSYCFNVEEKNIDTLTQTGFYRTKNPNGLPVLGSVNWYHILVFKQSESYCLQLAYSMTSKVYFTSYYRIMDNGAWQPWQKVATTSTLSLMEQQISELEIQLLENEV